MVFKIIKVTLDVCQNMKLEYIGLPWHLSFCMLVYYTIKRISDGLFVHPNVHLHKTVTMYTALQQLIYHTYNQASHCNACACTRTTWHTYKCLACAIDDTQKM